MSAIFVHVSDIHFGQEKDDRLHIHNDVKQCLIDDAGEFIKSLPGKVAHGILATGDIAHSGKWDQYVDAGKWLDQLATAIGCEIHRIQLVPGNHDVDRDKLSRSGTHLLNDIRAGGTVEYEAILGNDNDRLNLYARFEDYIQFAEGYDCTLDTTGRYSTNLHVELAPNRSLRFVRLNSSLLCTGNEDDENPELIVGARQFTIPRKNGEEVIALIHHPMNWFKDSEAADTYLRSRARVLISGHEHNPRVNVVPTTDGGDYMMLAAGATVPFKSNDEYTFTYNIIEFDWDAEQDALIVVIHPRAWDRTATRFVADDNRLGGSDPKFVLSSPNFRKGVVLSDDEAKGNSVTPASEEPVVEVVASVDAEGDSVVAPEEDGYRLVLLRFFRDITEANRLLILGQFGALDDTENERITQSVQRKLLDWLVSQGKLTEVAAKIDELINDSEKGK